MPDHFGDGLKKTREVLIEKTISGVVPFSNLVEGIEFLTEGFAGLRRREPPRLIEEWPAPTFTAELIVRLQELLPSRVPRSDGVDRHDDAVVAVGEQ